MEQKQITPEEVIKLFGEYVKNLTENPIMVHDFVGKDGDSVNRKRSRLLSMAGFRTFCHSKQVSIKTLKKNIEFNDVFDKIDDHIFSENIEGAAAGIYSASIIQRIHGLVEKQEVQTKNIDVKMNLGDKINGNNLQQTEVS